MVNQNKHSKISCHSLQADKTRTTQNRPEMSQFQALMTKKGLLGGKYSKEEEEKREPKKKPLEEKEIVSLLLA